MTRSVSPKSQVLLLSPGIIKASDLDFGLPHLVSIGSYLKQHLPVEVTIIDLGYESGGQGDLIRTIKNLATLQVIGISCYSSFDYLRVLNLGYFFKRFFPKIPVVVGGYHVSALPEEFIFDGSPFDVAVVGEGEEPMRRIVETILGGETLEKGMMGPHSLSADELPPYDWHLLGKYLKNAGKLGRKFQIYLSRGCPHHCTFCMERSKGEYKWQPFDAQRAIDELERLSKVIDLSQWIVNISDPLFGYKTTWRRTVLKGIVKKGIVPRHFWALTRAEGLEETDVALFAKARFSIGVGLESGSPEMLTRMQKTRRPDEYLAAFENVHRWSLIHQMNFGANLILGHPGETPKTMKETYRFVDRFVSNNKTLQSWLSFDPFRLYPGSLVHQEQQKYEAECGTVFHQPNWWRRWSNTGFRAEHIDPSHALAYEDRVQFMYAHYPPVLQSIKSKFRGPNSNAKQVFQKSIDSQTALLTQDVENKLLRYAAVRQQSQKTTPTPTDVMKGGIPMGFHVRGRFVQLREGAVKKLLDKGLLKTTSVVDALLSVEIEKILNEDEALAIFSNQNVGFSMYAQVLEMLALKPSERLLHLSSSERYLSALFSKLCNVVSYTGNQPLEHHANLGLFDAAWFGKALPVFPPSLLKYLLPSGRFGTVIGPMWGAQDLALVRKKAEGHQERFFARVKVAPALGKSGWYKK